MSQKDKRIVGAVNTFEIVIQDQNWTLGKGLGKSKLIPKSQKSD